MPDLLAENPLAVAEVFVTRASEALAADAVSEDIAAGNAFVFAGDLVWDECCGVLAGTVLRTFRTVSFPSPVTTVTNCDASELCVDVAVLLLRCMPGIDEANRIPTFDDIQTASMVAAHDAAVIANALSGELPEGWERANFEQTITADADCIVVDTRFTIGLPQSFWCAPEPAP